MNKRKLLQETDLFVLDMDGTFYLGNKIIEGALAFLAAVEKAGKSYLFFTNNSSKTSEDYILKLRKMNCKIKREKILTSGDVTIQYLQKNYKGKAVFLVGTRALWKSFEKAGIRLTKETPDIVVVGFDTSLTYKKLERACTYVRNGALFLATHPDINCPVEGGFIPDCGAFCSVITLSSGKKPKYLGKPFKETVDMILERTGAQREKTAFVGDRLYTDVAAGIANGAKGILVLTGETKRTDIGSSAKKPSGVYSSLGEMAKYLSEGIE